MEPTWIWQRPGWPRFIWSDEAVAARLRGVRLGMGVLLGMATASGLDGEQALDALLANIIASSAIEGESLDACSLRSSLARRLGLSEEEPWPLSDRSEGLSSIMLDAIQGVQEPLTPDRLFQWHRWLFPERAFRLHELRVGELRGGEPMQVVSGRIDRPVVHFEASPRAGLEAELQAFLDWFEESRGDALLDPLLRAGISHFWFITLHPFDDGNGRLACSITDLALAQADQQSIRLYAMAAAILARRADYYRVLEHSQRGSLDITEWLLWFLDTLDATLGDARQAIERTLVRSRFWQRYHAAGLSAEQCKVLNRLLEGGERGFEQGISAAQYRKVAGVSKATATRHLADLLDKGCLERLPGGGRSTRYRVRPL